MCESSTSEKNIESSKDPLEDSIFILLLLEIPLAYFLAFTLNFKEMGIFSSIAICHSLHAFTSLYFFRKGRWKKVLV